MKNIYSSLLLICFVSVNLMAQNSIPSSSTLPKYIPVDQSLHDVIVDLDKRFFDAYNTCDVSVHEELIAED